MSDSQRRDYAVLVSLATREEAEVAASALRADGIAAFVGNAHHAHMEWGLVIAQGGLQIMVPAAALAEARAALKARVADWKQEPVFDQARRRDRWQVWILIGLFFTGLLFVGVNSLDRAEVQSILHEIESQRQMRAFSDRMDQLWDCEPVESRGSATISECTPKRAAEPPPSPAF